MEFLFGVGIVIGLILIGIGIYSAFALIDFNAAERGEAQHPFTLAVLFCLIAAFSAFLFIGSVWSLMGLSIWFFTIPYVAWMLWDIGLIWAPLCGVFGCVSWMLLCAVARPHCNIIATLFFGIVFGFVIVSINDWDARRLIERSAERHGLSIVSIRAFSEGFSDRYYRQAVAEKSGCRYYWKYISSEWRRSSGKNCPHRLTSADVENYDEQSFGNKRSVLPVTQ